MPRRANRIYTDRQRATLARSARASEDPGEMTASATMTRMAKYVARVLTENPNLTPDQAARAATLLCRADMIRVRAGEKHTPADVG